MFLTCKVFVETKAIKSSQEKKYENDLNRQFANM